MTNTQVDYYTKYISERPDWELIEVYTDEGISAVSTKRRDGFKRMIADALAGRIDLIVTKSVSRFARNTVDSLQTIRQLKEKGVECYFEKENIWTFDGKGELLITIMSSLAQEESRSISENVVWGQRKRFADGKVTVPIKRCLGYDMGADRNLVINPEQGMFRDWYRVFHRIPPPALGSSCSSASNPCSIIAVNVLAMKGNATTSRKKLVRMVIGKPSERRFICGAAFERIPMHT